ncbi:alpha/beta hydrolase family protein [Fodinicurvata halophila]|uniref:alpha/beta hydrolase family protein n=1 Tax=Fodinicurvata halophila TaxID=1419723 RepID=UPI0036284F33
MRTEKLEFAGHSGESLAARLDRPDGRVRAVALFAHCFTCSKDLRAARRIAARLSALGFAVLRFDFTGLGHSEGSSPTRASPPMWRIWCGRPDTWRAWD